MRQYSRTIVLLFSILIIAFSIMINVSYAAKESNQSDPPAPYVSLKDKKDIAVDSLEGQANTWILNGKVKYGIDFTIAEGDPIIDLSSNTHFCMADEQYSQGRVFFYVKNYDKYLTETNAHYKELKEKASKTSNVEELNRIRNEISIIKKDFLIPGSISVVYKNAAYDKDGNRYSVKLTLSNMKFLDFIESEANGKYISLTKCNREGLVTVTYNSYTSIDCKEAFNTRRFSSGVRYDVEIKIGKYDSNKNSWNDLTEQEDGKFVFCLEDIDTGTGARNNGKVGYGYGDKSEGINFINGIDKDTIRVTKNSFLYGKYAKNNKLTRITGSALNLNNDRSAFVSLADAKSTTFQWTAGIVCGSSLNFKYQLPRKNLSNNITIYYRDIDDKTDIEQIEVATLEEGSSKTKENSHPTIEGYTNLNQLTIDDGKLTDGSKATIKYDGNNHTITFWYKKEATVTIRHREQTADNEEKEIPYYPDKIIKITDKTELQPETIDEYIYIGVQKDNENRQDGIKSIIVEKSDDGHVITFWYMRLPVVNIRYVLLNNMSADLKNGQDIIPPKIDKFTSFNEEKTYYAGQISELSNAYTYIKGTLDGIAFEEDNAKVKNNGKDREVIFGYVMNAQVKVIGVCGKNTKQFSQETVNVPLNKAYSAPTWPGYKIASDNNTKVIKKTLVWKGEGPDTPGGKATVTLTIDERKNGIDKILIIFFYDSNFKATVKHIYKNPITGEEKLLEETQTPITPGNLKTVSSKKFDNYLNLEYKINPNTEIKDNGFKKYDVNIYNISFTPDENNYEMVFYYTSQKITIKHEYPDGTPVIDPVTKILDPNNPEGPLPNKDVDYYKLNDDPNKKINIGETITVPIKPGQGEQTLVFVYKKPELIFENPNPNPDPDPEYPKLVKKYRTGIIPNDMNNQLIGQDSNKYYWVLDENGEITVRLAYKHMKLGKSTVNVNIKIPFEVYINNASVPAGTLISITLSPNSSSDGDYDVFEGKLTGIRIPVWTEEKEYEISATANYKYIDGENKETSINGDAFTKVTVVGAVYDFSVTNIDGSSTTGDAMWKASLFTNPILTSAKKSNGVVEYETNILPIGQSSQQNSKYNYGMKLGTKFYFSVNTKGAKNTAIEITPKYYYFDKTGKGGSVVTVRSGNKDITNLTRTTTLTDANRTIPPEYQKELAQGRTTYGSNAYSNAKPTVLADRLITIGTGLRMPFVNYGEDPTSTKYHEVSTSADKAKIYKNASHWYADYVIPNDAKFYDANNKELTDGYVVVAFSIRTKAGNSPYLAYNLDSPFTSNGQSEWKYEGATSMSLPKTASLTSGMEVGNMVRAESRDVKNPYAHASVAIYQISPTTRTSQNVDSTGTH